MKTLSLFLFAIFLMLCSFGQKPLTDKEILKNYSEIPASFRPNMGQWENNILFRAGSERGAVTFLSEGMSFGHRLDKFNGNEENAESVYRQR